MFWAPARGSSSAQSDDGELRRRGGAMLAVATRPAIDTVLMMCGPARGDHPWHERADPCDSHQVDLDHAASLQAASRRPGLRGRSRRYCRGSSPACRRRTDPQQSTSTASASVTSVSRRASAPKGTDFGGDAGRAIAVDVGDGLTCGTTVRQLDRQRAPDSEANSGNDGTCSWIFRSPLLIPLTGARWATALGGWTNVWYWWRNRR